MGLRYDIVVPLGILGFCVIKSASNLGHILQTAAERKTLSKPQKTKTKKIRLQQVVIFCMENDSRMPTDSGNASGSFPSGTTAHPDILVQYTVIGLIYLRNLVTEVLK